LLFQKHLFLEQPIIQIISLTSTKNKGFSDFVKNDSKEKNHLPDKEIPS